MAIVALLAGVVALAVSVNGTRGLPGVVRWPLALVVAVCVWLGVLFAWTMMRRVGLLVIVVLLAVLVLRNVWRTDNTPDQNR